MPCMYTSFMMQCDVRPIKPLIYWELRPGMKLTLPEELESFLIREELAEAVESSVITPAEVDKWD